MHSHTLPKRIAIWSVLAMLLFNAVSIEAEDGYISARSFAESQGIAYQWFPLQKILVMRQGLKTVRLTVDSQTAIVNGSEVTLPAPPRIQQGQIMVPAAALNRFFSASEQPNVLQTPAPRIQVQPSPPPSAPVARQQPASPAAHATPIAVTPAPAEPPQPVAITPAPQPVQTQSDEAILVALRHSSREDHTRVVLEFSGDITYRSEFKDGLYRLTIVGCRNLIPTQRTNPVGRDIAKLDINSGPDRKGLILSFYPKNTVAQPTIETVGGPFRMIISFAAPDAQVATSTTELVASATVVANPAQEPKTPEQPKMESAPEINIAVEIESLKNPDFAGRTIIIDAGHGGTDTGFRFAGRPEEKVINLEIARHLASSLEKAGFKAVLTRNSDISMSHDQRLSIVNRHGGDLYISLHLGGSSDASKAGTACFSYSSKGTHIEESGQGISPEAVYNDWLKATRFDLGIFLARKINERLVRHLKVESRGVRELPLQPLKFVMIPAVLVEAGMLSDATEGKNLISDNYRKAVARSIANAVVDFFNGIVINQ
ncbi:MAG: hypothetical protein GQF41_0029 [Candidatus Rifleibacterium amylolyticum]|nr:MAG: hypothetical protein GQF41_0029 [Candidatus Rifleibacterium amylolyticum]